MLNYTKLNHLLNFIPKGVRAEEDDLDLLTYALDAYRMLKVPQRLINNIVILPINDHKVIMPEGLTKINMVTYTQEPPKSKDDCDSLLCSLKIPKPPKSSIPCGCHNPCDCNQDPLLHTSHSIPRQPFYKTVIPATIGTVTTENDCGSVFGTNLTGDFESVFDTDIDECLVSSVFDDEDFECSCTTEQINSPGYALYSCCPKKSKMRMGNLCKMPINYRLFLNSNFYNQCNQPLKYVGNSKGWLCEGCPNKQVQCEETFSINPVSREIIVSCDSGFICLNYECEVRDESGDFLIIDHPRVRNFLRLWTLYMHWNGRANFKEQGTFNMSDKYLYQAEIAFKAAKGILRQRAVDKELIRQIDGYDNPTIAILKIPSTYGQNSSRQYPTHIHSKKPYGNNF